MLSPIDGEDAVAVLVLEAEGDTQRLEGDAVPRHVIRQDLVVPVIPMMIVQNPGFKEIVNLIIILIWRQQSAAVWDSLGFL